MSVQIWCPHCDVSCRVPEKHLGRRVRCAGCRETFIAEDVPTAELDADPPPRKPKPVSQPPALLQLPNDEDAEEVVSSAPVRLGKRDNPFVESATLTPSQADPSAFEFDFDEEVASPSKKKLDRKGKSATPEPAKRSEEKPKRDSKRSQRSGDADTDDSLDDDSSEFENERPNQPNRKKAPSARDEDEEGFVPPSKNRDAATPPPSAETNDSPFSFDFANEKPAVDGSPKKSRPSHHDTEPIRSKRVPDKKRMIQGASDDDAGFLGLRNIEEPAQAPAKMETLPAEKDSVQGFHLRQSGYWKVLRLFRVFVEAEQLAFIPAAEGDDVPATEDALRSENLDGVDKRIRKVVRDLNEHTVGQLIEANEDSFCWSAAKIDEIVIDASPAGKKLPAGCRSRTAILKLVHKTKGTVEFDFVSNTDVVRASKFLPQTFANVLKVNVRWDKASKRFVSK